MKALKGSAYSALNEPFSDRMKCCLTYTERFPSFIGNSSAATTYEYCGNDLFDPNFTGTGGQPKYFDQLSALYNRYRVYSSAIEVIGYNTTTAQTTYVDLVVVPVNTTTAAFSVDSMMSLPRAQWRSCNVNRPVKIQSHVTTSTQLGVKDVEGADRLQALVTASPAERWLWAIGARSYDNSTASTFNVDVKVTYYCEFYDRKIQTDSLFRQSISEKKDSKGLSVEEKTPYQSPTNSDADADAVVVAAPKRVVAEVASKFDFMKRGLLSVETPGTKTKDKKL
jgi:hypothetical protein